MKGNNLIPIIIMQIRSNIDGTFGNRYVSALPASVY